MVMFGLFFEALSSGLSYASYLDGKSQLKRFRSRQPRGSLFGGDEAWESLLTSSVVKLYVLFLVSFTAKKD